MSGKLLEDGFNPHRTVLNKVGVRLVASHKEDGREPGQHTDHENAVDVPVTAFAADPE